MKSWLASAAVSLLAAIACAQSTAPTEVPAPGRTGQIYHSEATGPLRIAVVGLTHDHAHNIVGSASRRDDITLVGVYEPNQALFDRYAARYKLDPALRYDDLDAMLEATKPEAASIMNAIADHASVIETCAKHRVHTLVEKPLAFSTADATRIAAAARENHVLVLTNYETSWYASLREAKRLVDSGDMAPIRRMVFRHGHRGPREIGCSAEFLDWLTDANANGGGAIVDFGCYGAVLATWLMDGERPTQVTATASRLKPDVYPDVDDDATIVLSYPTATAVIQASWAWTHDNKEMDIHTERGSIHTGKWDSLSIRRPDKSAEPVTPTSKPDHLRDEWTYLREVIRGRCEIDALSSLELNIIVAEILDEARGQVGKASND